ALRLPMPSPNAEATFLAADAMSKNGLTVASNGSNRASHAHRFFQNSGTRKERMASHGRRLPPTEAPRTSDRSESESSENDLLPRPMGGVTVTKVRNSAPTANAACAMTTGVPRRSTQTAAGLPPSAVVPFRPWRAAPAELPRRAASAEAFSFSR